MVVSTLNDPRYDVFETEPADRETFSSWELIKQPLESLENKGNIRFRIDPSEVDWMDLNKGEITFEARIVRKDGSALHTTDTKDAAGKTTDTKDECVLINNAAHAVFKDARIRLNESLVAGGDGNYSHIAFMANQYQYTHGSKSTFKHDEGYYSPEFHKVEFDDFEHSVNKALLKAYEGSKWVPLVLPLSTLPILNQPKAIPPARKFELELVRNDADFCIWAKKKTPAQSYEFQLRAMELHVPMLRPSQNIQHGMSPKMTTSTMIYNYTDLGVYRNTIMAHQLESEIYDVFHHKDVKLAFFAFMPAKIYSDQNSRKYIFKRHGLETIDLRSEGRCIAGKPLQADKIPVAYHQMNRVMKLNFQNEDIGITRDDFDRYANVYVFDCTPGKHFEQRQDTHTRDYNLYLKFKNPIPENLDLFSFYTEDKQFNLQPGNLVVPNDYAESG